MNEYSLHSALKNWYSLPGDQLEVRIKDYIVDISRGDLLIEIQTKNFSSIKKKLSHLVKNHKVRLVHPIPEKKWISKVNKYREVISRRKSPKKGKLTDLFHELIRIPKLVGENNFSLEVLMIDEEEIRFDDGKGSWRRKGVSIIDRKLINVNSKTQFKNKNDYLRFLPANLDETFTNRKLSYSTGISIRTAQRITYCLRKSGVLKVVGRRGKKLRFKRSEETPL